MNIVQPRSDLCNPEAILVLLTNDLVAIDCRSTGLPSYENPYAMDFQVDKSGLAIGGFIEQ